MAPDDITCWVVGPLRPHPPLNILNFLNIHALLNWICFCLRLQPLVLKLGFYFGIKVSALKSVVLNVLSRLGVFCVECFHFFHPSISSSICPPTSSTVLLFLSSSLRAASLSAEEQARWWTEVRSATPEYYWQINTKRRASESFSLLWVYIFIYL